MCVCIIATECNKFGEFASVYSSCVVYKLCDTNHKENWILWTDTLEEVYAEEIEPTLILCGEDACVHHSG